MNKIFSTVLSIATGALLFTACSNDHNNCPNNQKERQEVEVSAQINWLRAGDTNWDAGDQIGLYAYNSGEALSEASLYDSKSNIPYVTNGGNGFFDAVGEKILLPPTETVDLIAYYPYTADLSDVYTLPFNTSDQSDLPKIDILYSDNATGLSSDQNKATLQFTHQLTKVIYEVEANGNDLSGAKIALDGVLLDGSMDLKSGAVTTGTTVGNPEVALVAGDAPVDYRGVMILPPQEYLGKKLSLMVGDRVFKGDLPTFTTKSGFEYVVRINYTVQGSQATLRIETSTISDWNKGEQPTEIVEVEAKIEVTEVTFAQEALTLEVGETHQVEVTIMPVDASDKALTWSSSDATVASVDDGLITALKEGNTIIKAVAKNGDAQDELALTVTPPFVAVIEVKLEATTKLLNVGDSYTFKATVLPNNATDKSLTWVSSDETIATVENGKVTALKAGTATVTATSANGLKGEVVVTVADGVIPVIPGEDL